MAPAAPESADKLPAPSDSRNEDVEDRDRELEIPSDAGTRTTAADPAAIRRPRWLQCQQCHYKTSRKNRLLKHQNTKHQNAKHQNARHPAGNNNSRNRANLTCTHEGCDKTFGRSTSLDRHLEITHSNQDHLILLHCQQCNYKTYRKYRLQHHQNAEHKL